MFFSSWNIRIGDFDHSSGEDNRYAENLGILKSSIHPLFKENEAYFDIAILESTPIETSDIIKPICLPSSEMVTSESNYDYVSVHLTGWGSKVDAGTPSKKLQRVILTAFPQRYWIN